MGEGPYILVDNNGSGELDAVGPFKDVEAMWEWVDRVWPKHWGQPTKHHVADVVDPEWAEEQIKEHLQEEAEHDQAGDRA
jgi:hypothetical protein